MANGMTETTTPGDTRPRLESGLCRDCMHSRRMESDRGSIFLMCELSFKDPQFAKYPRLPVLVCSGYQSPHRT